MIFVRLNSSLFVAACLFVCTVTYLSQSTYASPVPGEDKYNQYGKLKKVPSGDLTRLLDQTVAKPKGILKTIKG